MSHLLFPIHKTEEISKRRIKYIFTLLLPLIAATTYGQDPFNLTQFEKNPKQEVETLVVNGDLRRQSDAALLELSGVSIPASGVTPIEVASNFIAEKWNEFRFNTPMEQNIDFYVEKTMNSGTIVRYRQFFHGLPVDQRGISVKLNRQNRVRSLQNSTVPIRQDLNLNPQISADLALDSIKKHLNISQKPRYEKVELMIHVIGLNPFLCWQVNIVPTDNMGDWECYVDAISGEILEVGNISCALNGTGNAFNPNPTFSANVPYGTGGFIDDNDATNSDLDGQMLSVTLPDITMENGMYRLVGPYAAVVDPAGQYQQDDPDFSFTRDQDGFEAANCYYYIDKTMRYVNETLNVAVEPIEYSGGVRYKPHQYAYPNAKFDPDTGELTFGDGWEPIPSFFPSDVDSGEDGAIISHEMGHALHHWQTNEMHSRNEGLSEGLSDYWGASQTRDCGDANNYEEWDPAYHQVFNWGLFNLITTYNAQRTTAFTSLDYCGAIGNQPDEHPSGQWMSTALMRIFSDLGKYKTDLLVLEAMPQLVNDGGNTVKGGVDLQTAGKYIFQTAIDLEYSDNDICIIYKHLKDVLCIDKPLANVPAPIGNMGNVYMKDTQCDNGEEINPDNGPMWLSEDIWIRHEQDGGLEHQNPEYKQNSPNWVYARIRGIGCNALNNAQLRLYFSKASTGLVWPTMWNDFYLMGPNGPVLAGDEITAVPIDIPAIEPGAELIVSIPWYPPNPADFNTEKHHFCLLGRILSTDDPMFISETASVYNNTKNNNNIAWKNVSVFDETPNNMLGPIAVYLGCDGDFQGGSLGLLSAQNSWGKSIHELGNVYVELQEPLKSSWLNGGMPGDGFSLAPDGRIRAADASFSLDGLNISSCNQYVNVYFEPFDRERFAAFDLVQYDHQGKLAGGERFEYRPNRQSEQRFAAKPEQAGIQSDWLSIYPNPVESLLNLSIKKRASSIATITVFSTLGVPIFSQKVEDHEDQFSFDLSSLVPGLYLLAAQDLNGKIVDGLKFIKQ